MQSQEKRYQIGSAAQPRGAEGVRKPMKIINSEFKERKVSHKTDRLLGFEVQWIIRCSENNKFRVKRKKDQPLKSLIKGPKIVKFQ